MVAAVVNSMHNDYCHPLLRLLTFVPVYHNQPFAVTGPRGLPRVWLNFISRTQETWVQYQLPSSVVRRLDSSCSSLLQASDTKKLTHWIHSAAPACPIRGCN